MKPKKTVLKPAGPNLELPWQASVEEDSRFKKVLRVSLVVFLVLAIVVPLIPVPELTREERETLPPQLARVVLEEKKLPPPPPPPPPKPEEKKPEPEPVQEEKPPEPKKPEEQPKPEPVVDKVAEAKKKAATAGLLQFQDDLAAMRDALDVAAVDSANLSRGAQQAAKVDRSVITSQAKGTSGGINTAALSRDTGGVALSGRETTVVESDLATRTGSGTEAVAGERNQSARSDEEIRQIMDRSKGAIFAIYNRALRSNPALQGKVVVRLVIEPDGRISSAEIVSSELNDKDLESKLLARIQLIAFNASQVVRTTLNYSFDFLPN